MTPSEFRPDVWYRLSDGDWQLQWRGKLNSWFVKHPTGEECFHHCIMSPDLVTRNDWEPVEPEPPACQDYGEPLAYGDWTISNHKGKIVSGAAWFVFLERAVACVNALTGIADPAEWVKEAKRALNNK